MTDWTVALGVLAALALVGAWRLLYLAARAEDREIRRRDRVVTPQDWSKP